MPEKRQIVILGNGIAGITAARHLRKRCDDPICIISDETDHFFSRTALMYIYMGHMSFEDTKPYEDWFWQKNRLDLHRGRVREVDPVGRVLRMAGGEPTSYDVLILASGSVSNKFGWPGQDLEGVQGLYSYPDLRLMERNTRSVRRAVVVGGGLIGVETAEMLHARGIPVTFLVRETSWMDFAFPSAESEMIGRHIRAQGIDLRLSTELERIDPNDGGRVGAVVTKSGERIECEFVALTVGVRPNVDFLAGSGIECGKGVLVDEQLRTNHADVYAIGDCAELRSPPPGRRAIEPVWYTGRAMGETVARTVCGEPTRYDPGIWFNSAKFFDLEWQVYGDVPARPGDGIETLFWEDPAGGKSIRINYRAGDGAVVGFHLMGIRYRHEVCEAWIRAGLPVNRVLARLGEANFDPELYPQHEYRLVDVFNRRHPDRVVQLERRRGLRSWFAQRRAG